jgi:hypothetical protein
MANRANKDSRRDGRAQTMHEPGRDEGPLYMVEAELADGPDALDERYFIPRERFIEILGDAPRMDYKEFCREVDTYVDSDPTPREWPERSPRSD